MPPATLLAALLSAATPGRPAIPDHWLQIDPFRSPADVVTSVYLLAGVRFDEGKRVTPSKATDFTRCELREPQGNDAILDRVHAGAPELLRLDMERLALGANSYLLAVDERPVTVELAAPVFQALLREEGLQDVLSLREKQGHEKAPGELRYSHEMKAIFQRGNAPDDFVIMPSGQDLEIVVLQNPYKLKPGADLPLLVQFHGRPLPASRVTATNRSGGKTHSRTVRSDSLGRATIVLDQPGDWMLRAVAIEPSKEPDADWRGYWTSLTFAIGD